MTARLGPSGRLLDMGATLEARTLSPGVTHVACDLFPREPSVQKGDIQALPFGRGEFDAVVVAELLEHVERPLTALRECARVLRPGGTLVITAPWMWPVHQDLRCPYYDFTRWSDRQWRAALTEVGLAVVTLEPQGGLLTVCLECWKALVRQWPRPLRWVGYLGFPLADWLERSSQARWGPPPACQCYTTGWLIVAVRGDGE